MLLFIYLLIYLDKIKLIKRVNERKMCNENPDHSRKSLESNPSYEEKTLLAK